MPEKPPSSRERPQHSDARALGGDEPRRAASQASRPMRSFSPPRISRSCAAPRILKSLPRRRRARPRRLFDRRPQHACRHRARPSRGEDDRRPLCRRLPPRLSRRHAGHRRLADRPRRLRTALPAPHHRQSPHQEGRVPSRPRRPPRMGRRGWRWRCCPAAHRPLRESGRQEPTSPSMGRCAASRGGPRKHARTVPSAS